ncbi:B- and T-lymphocyte attenuator isoform X1 [Sphaeramia orbicularis]|uniref:B- and T-lymphocyte attenuator isoform X1 n=1 Tax=Sphaeramia orbicularis TaxID=375764 RepID=UPI001180E1AF|nr:B- and T-lymphocyte attenuator isoform X1 [Sphaeramia orbicularis]
MNMSNLSDTLMHSFLLIFTLCTISGIHGKGQGLIPSCEVEVILRWGLTCETAPQQTLTVDCPVKHCGEPHQVAWCKLLETYACEEMNNTEDIEITQRDENDQRNSVSHLTFRRISLHDDGLYRCGPKLHKNMLLGHIINVSVSDHHHGDVNCVFNTVKISNPVPDESVEYEPYFFICLSVVVLVFTLTAIVFLGSNGWKRIQSYNLKKGQEMSTHMIPGLPSGNTSVLASHLSIVNDIYSQSTPEMLSSLPSQRAVRGQPGANTAGTSQVSDHTGYAVINPKQSGIPATGTVICVSNLSDSP